MDDKKMVIKALSVYKAQLMDVACSPAWFPSEKARAKEHLAMANQCQMLMDEEYRIKIAERRVD